MTGITRFSEGTRAAVLGAIRLGVSVEAASRAAGIDRTTLWRWVQRGRNDLENGVDSEWADFARDYDTVEAELVGQVEAELVGQVEANVVSASRENWKAGAWWLSRRKPDVYGQDGASAIAEQVADTLLHRIRTRCKAETYRDVVDHVLGNAIEVRESE